MVPSIDLYVNFVGLVWKDFAILLWVDINKVADVWRLHGDWVKIPRYSMYLYALHDCDLRELMVLRGYV